MTAAIRFRDAVALVGRFPVLAGMDLEVSSGEVVCLQGPNGAGKTSLLRACAGLLRVVRGTAEVLGADLVADPTAVRRRVGLLGHTCGLYDDLTAEENARFALRASGLGHSRAGAALEEMGLTGRLGSVPVGRLSAGQRRRVAVAILAAREPELWLLDEPHAGLDAEHRDLLDRLVRRAVEGGATVLFASHEHERAGGLAGKVVAMQGGAAAGDPTSQGSTGKETIGVA